MNTWTYRYLKIFTWSRKLQLCCERLNFSSLRDEQKNPSVYFFFFKKSTSKDLQIIQPLIRKAPKHNIPQSPQCSLGYPFLSTVWCRKSLRSCYNQRSHVFHHFSELQQWSSALTRKVIKWLNGAHSITFHKWLSWELEEQTKVWFEMVPNCLVLSSMSLLNFRASIVKVNTGFLDWSWAQLTVWVSWVFMNWVWTSMWMFACFVSGFVFKSLGPLFLGYAPRPLTLTRIKTQNDYFVMDQRHCGQCAF